MVATLGEDCILVAARHYLSLIKKGEIFMKLGIHVVSLTWPESPHSIAPTLRNWDHLIDVRVPFASNSNRSIGFDRDTNEVERTAPPAVPAKPGHPVASPANQESSIRLIRLFG